VYFGAQRHPIQAGNVPHDGGCSAATGIEASDAIFLPKKRGHCGMLKLGS